jgi:hypothetical protein
VFDFALALAVRMESPAFMLGCGIACRTKQIMRFEYEISADEYASCMAAYNALARGEKRIVHAVFWIVSGLLFISVAWNEQAVSWAPILLTASGGYWIYCGLAGLFPSGTFAVCIQNRK